ncbi:MAG: hypothetical protein ABJP48_03090 [Erythrobacter sp.]
MAIILAVLPLALTACGAEPPLSENVISQDPVVARALNDPLMVDPDLSYRNQANAALTIGVGHALPVFEGSEQLARRAREEARLQLLEDGPILELPLAGESKEGAELAGLVTAPQMALAHGVPEQCVDALQQGFIWAARLDRPAAIMPYGQVRAAAGSDKGDCNLRVISYATPASIEDTLQYHFNLARRSNMSVETFASPESALLANGEGQQFAVNLRAGPRAMTAVEIVHWSE